MLDMFLYKKIPFTGFRRRLSCSQKLSGNSCNESNTSDPKLLFHFTNKGFSIIFKSVISYNCAHVNLIPNLLYRLSYPEYHMLMNTYVNFMLTLYFFCIRNFWFVPMVSFKQYIWNGTHRQT